MEENQRKGPGVFYAVVGVATLVVAIIGATFAYFSASVTPGNGSDTITGQTQDISGASLTLTVNKITFAGTTADYNTLVPAFFGTTTVTEQNPSGLVVPTPADLTSTQVTSMLSNKCEKNGFTGCHVYRITISANQDITHANLLLGLTTDASNKNQWGYVVFSGTETPNSSDNTKTDSLTVTSLNAASHGAPAAIGNGLVSTPTDNRIDLHSNGSLTTNTTVTYYLLIYVNDTNVVQNDSETTANYVVGGYSGNLELQALGGVVRASFVSQQ